MKVVVIFSGGMDSTALLYSLRAQGHTLKTISFDYGQRHRVELKHAEKIAREATVPHQEIDLSAIASVIAGQSSQVNPDVEVPDGHYTEESMKATVVPNRNMIMLSVAVAHAISIDFDVVAYGAHAGDHAIYPDCRQEFVDAMKSVVSICDWKRIELMTPFIDKSKAQIATIGHEVGAPFGHTWSCYKGGVRQCGTCGTCVERKEAFVLAGLHDPSKYL